MEERIQNAINNIKSLQTAENTFIERLLVDVYRLLDSTKSTDYNSCLSIICHIANTNNNDIMIQQLLHDCIIKSRIFLYDNLLFKNNHEYQPFISAQDVLLQSFYTSNRTNTTLTKPQKEIFDAFQKNKRLIVSAPTSFGKTRIVREMISHNEYKNIALIMPTVSLLSEMYQDLRKGMERYTLSKSSKVKIDHSKRYILILTPERMSTFLEEHPDFNIDFFVMDEIYKIDYKLADDRFRIFSDILYHLAKTTADFYLIGPYITDFSHKFRRKFGAKLKCYDLEVVQKDHYSLDNIKNKGQHTIEAGTIRIIGDKFENLLRLVSEESIDGKFLIYRYQKRYVENTAIKFLQTFPVKPHNKELTKYLSQTISNDWDLISCIKRGVAFHHGAMPRHIQDLIVDEFNDISNKGIDYLFCTTSLTEGINSAAKNVVLYDKKIGNGDPLKTLDRKNIEGRAGRFMQHFIGRVFNLEVQDDDDSKTIVEVEFLDKEIPSIESLIQLEFDDIPPGSKEIYDEYTNTLDSLGIEKEIISENKFVRVTGQLALIEHLRKLNNLDKYYFNGQLPTEDYLDNILSTIYNFLFTDHDKGRVYYTPSFKCLLQSNTVQRARKSDNARIRYVFDLMSKYFEFVWPKYLKSFENMYNFVAFERSQKTIDLAMLIAQLEYGTTKNHEIILRDFGLPHEIVKKISKYFKQCESFEDIQKIKIRKRKKIKKEIYPIEYKILNKYL